MARKWARHFTDDDFREHLLANREIDSNGCWNWTRARAGTGRYAYGRLWYPKLGYAVQVHRLAAHLWLGLELDSPLYACHTCDNPPCFNPEHLFIGTNSENIIDAREKGRLNRQRGEERPGAKLTEDQVRAIRARHAQGDISFADLGALYGVVHQTARAICQRKTWAHVA